MSEGKGNVVRRDGSKLTIVKPLCKCGHPEWMHGPKCKPSCGCKVYRPA